MERKIKMIWDFRGPSALRTAEHHIIHLKEYMEMEKLSFHECDVASESEFIAMAYIIVDEPLVAKMRADLKPHRGQLAQ